MCLNDMLKIYIHNMYIIYAHANFLKNSTQFKISESISKIPNCTFMQVDTHVSEA